MQREREGRNDLYDMGHPFGIFRGFGSLWGRDPFDDQFFTRPFGSLFGPRAAPADEVQTDTAKGIVIQELNSDDEGQKEEDKGTEDEKDIRQKNSMSSKEPLVEHPDEDADERKINSVERMQPQARSFSKVTYGGVDGAYYTSTRTRRTGGDGVVVEESKEANRTTSQATHRISRGIHDKGHSVTRKLNSDGKVDTVQMLHNLNEDDLPGFEKAWKGNVKQHLPHWNDGFDMHGNSGSSSDEQKGKATLGGFLLPSREQTRNAGVGLGNEGRTNSSGERTKKVVRINIE